MPDEPSVTTPGTAPGRPDATKPADETTAVPAPTETAATQTAAEPDEATVATTATPAADEPTVALSATDEATVAMTAGADADATADDDATVAMTATPTPDEATIMLSTDSTPAEATTATPATPAADEATVAMTAAPAADEATIAMTATPAADEATVAMTPATPASADATVAMAAGAAPEQPRVEQPRVATFRPRHTAEEPEDATTLLPPGPGTAVPAPGAPAGSKPSPLTRRRLILGLSGAAGVALAGTAAVAIRSATSGSGKTPAASASGRPAVVTSRTPESAAVTASPVPVQRRPISTLAEYAKASGAPAFPSDAVALTIDDGPHPVWTPKILRLLDKYQIPAMFCMIGNQVLGHEAVAQMVTTAGHQLANHTWSHPTKLGTKPTTVTQKEIRKAQTKISNTTGYTPKLFRSPGGDWSPQLLRDIAHAGLLPLDWSNDPRDWTQPGVAKIEHRMLAARPGQILLCHDGGGDRSQTYKALSVVLPALKARGLQFVAL